MSLSLPLQDVYQISKLRLKSQTQTMKRVLVNIPVCEGLGVNVTGFQSKSNENIRGISQY